MIDLKTETPINLRQAARLLPSGRKGRPVHVSTLVRAITRGANGCKLEALRLGKQWVTTVEALQRWGEAQTPASCNQPRNRTSVARTRDGERAARRLEELGI
jgi:hypothetical protein